MGTSVRGEPSPGAPAWRSRSRRVAFGLGAAAWAGLAAFTWLDRALAPASTLPVLVGAAAFVLYLVTIAYVSYTRRCAADPANELRRRPGPLHPMRWWMGTIAVVGGFSVAVGLGFPEAMVGFAGRLAVETVVLGGVGVGLVFTLTGGPRTGPWASAIDAPGAPVEAPPGFLRAAGRLLAWQVGAAAAGAILLGPVLLLQVGFERFIDEPACRRLCDSQALRFESYFSGGRGVAARCACSGPDGPRRLHPVTTVTGGDSAAARVLDWLFRLGTSLVVGVGWPVVLILVVVRLRPGSVTWGRRGKPRA